MDRLDDDNDNLVDRAARVMANAPELGDFPQRLVRDVLQAAAPGNPADHFRPRPIVDRLKTINPLAKLAASVLIAASLLALGWAVFRATPVLAFAAVARQLHDAQTLTADLSIQQGGVAMNGKLLFAAPGRFRIEFADIPTEIADTQTGRIILIDHLHKSAIVMRIDDKDVPAPQAALTAESLDLFQQLRNISHTAGQPLGEADINGIHARQFNVTQEGQQFTIYADAKTGVPLRVQSNIKLGDDSVKVTLDHLALGQPIDPSLFSTAIPPGYTQQQATVSAAAPGETDLITFFKDYSGRTGIFPPSLKDLEKTLTPIIANAVQGDAPATTQSLPSADLMRFMVQTGRAIMFLNQLPTSADWHYAGASIKPSRRNASNQPIFWYHPKDATALRIIYADLHSADIPISKTPRGWSAETQVNH